MKIKDNRKVPREEKPVTRDHCDKCHIAKAAVIAEKGGELLSFCKHHGRKYGAVLVADGWTIREVVSA